MSHFAGGGWTLWRVWSWHPSPSEKAGKRGTAESAVSVAASGQAPRCRFVSGASGPVLLALVVTLAALSIGPAFGMVSWHGPDAHSRLPHRSIDSPLSAMVAATRSLPAVAMTPPRSSVVSEPQQLTGLLTAVSTFHPPR